ncbi:MULTISPECIES: RHS repeat-associated core domain-containing protein [Pseudomonas]|nr:RHS repeat-associated core domain-containing protein [Pseudomonas soli]PZW80399.1 RHS repeat-associated protein [Pseudomonas sp. 2848]
MSDAFRLLATDAQCSTVHHCSAWASTSMAYTVYGHTPSASYPTLMYAGKLRERSGFYSLGNGYRIYNPVLMRFHSADVLSPFLAGGINTYTYCEGNPVGWQDPSGHNRGRKRSFIPLPTIVEESTTTTKPTLLAYPIEEAVNSVLKAPIDAFPQHMQKNIKTINEQKSNILKTKAEINKYSTSITYASTPTNKAPLPVSVLLTYITMNKEIQHTHKTIKHNATHSLFHYIRTMPMESFIETARKIQAIRNVESA